MYPRLRPSLVLGVLLAVALLAPSTAAQEPEDADAPATALRVALGRALGEHALLLGEVVRSGIADSPDFDAAAAALEANTEDVVAAIDAVYGAEAADAFAELWRNHVAYIVDYARAVADGDADAAELAAEQLDRYVADFSGFLADALPALPPDAVEGLIGEHVQQLEHVASFDEREFGSAYAAVSETYGHMFEVGDALTIGIVSLFPDRFTGRDAAFSPATDLRMTLDRLLGEHTHLAAALMRALLVDAPSASGAIDVVAANSDALSVTIGRVYGLEAALAFAELWDRHVDAYAAYVTALAADDTAAADEARAELEAYQSDFGAYVADANPHLSAAALEALIGEHTELLVRQADAYAARDYDESYRLGREAYEHSGQLGAGLATAIADQFPQRFPDAAMAARPVGDGPVIGLAVLVGLLGLAALNTAWRRTRVAVG